MSPDEVAVIAAHDRALRAIDQARLAADPEDPALPTLLTPEMLRDTRIDIHQRSIEGLATRAGADDMAGVRYLEVQAVGDSARLTTCEVDGTVVYRVADGSIVNGDVVTAKWSVLMRRTPEGWKVASRYETAKWPGREMSQCVESA